VFLMKIKIFRRYGILGVHKPDINGTVNELSVLYDVTFVLKNASKYVIKCTCSYMLQKITLNMSVFIISCIE
jgi:hypothetical protein